MSVLRLMTEQDINKCTEVYIKAFPNEGKVADYYLEWTPKYFGGFITSEYCMLMHLYAVPHQKIELLTKL